MEIAKRIKAFVFRHHRYSLEKINELRDIVRAQPLVVALHGAEREARKDEGKGFRRKGVVYTVAIAGWDCVTLHSYISPEWDYVCFTDIAELLRLKAYGIWEIRPLAREEASGALTNRWHKTHPHALFPRHERSIYIDSNIDVRSGFLFEEIEKRKGSILLAPAHNDCRCIYKEIKRCLKESKETRESAEKVRQMLKKAGFPKNYGLTENGIVYRKHNDETAIGLMEEWWRLISSVSHRDQLSLSFLLWKRGIAVSDIALPNARYDGRNFRFYRDLLRFTN